MRQGATLRAHEELLITKMNIMQLTLSVSDVLNYVTWTGLSLAQLVEAGRISDSSGVREAVNQISDAHLQVKVSAFGHPSFNQAQSLLAQQDQLADAVIEELKPLLK